LSEAPNSRGQLSMPEAVELEARCQDGLSSRRSSVLRLQAMVAEMTPQAWAPLPPE
jgi:hypothetical protein